VVTMKNNWWIGLLVSILAITGQATHAAHYDFEGNTKAGSGKNLYAPLGGRASMVTDLNNDQVLEWNGCIADGSINGHAGSASEAARLAVTQPEDVIWGRLANPGFKNEPIKSAFFFAGNARNGVQFYEWNPSPTMNLYTIHPSDERHLQWSENSANRDYAVNTMMAAGINVIYMSFWGPRGTDNWVFWAPMQTSTYAHDELFEATLGKNVLIAPYIENYAPTERSPGYSFTDCFPGTADDPAPEFAAHVEDLIERYILQPQNEQWPSKWAQVYDQFGQKRYLVCIIGVTSSQEDLAHQRFAEGFDHVADRIYQDTGVSVGFAIAADPPGTYAWAPFLASPEHTGPWLKQQSSILAIQPYFSGYSLGVTDENTIMAWKQRFASRWINTGIPFIQDIAPGYDAHIVFPNSHKFGNTDSFREAQTQLIKKLRCQGVTFSAWNGYTEGYAGVPTIEYGDATYLWASNIFQDFTVDGCHPLPGRVEAEDYERMEGVQKEITGDDGGGLNIGWLDYGDWLEYKVAAPTSEEYTVRLRVARPNYNPTGRGQIRSGMSTLAVLPVPGTGGWQSWKTIETTIPLQAGEQILRLFVSTGGWNINWLEFRRQADIQWHELPGRIEAEDFDDMYGIRTVMVFDEEPGFNLDCLDAGDWIEYTIDVNKASEYRISLRVALAEGFSGSAGKLSVGGDVLWSFTVPTTGGWQTWETITGIADLSPGRQMLRIEVTKGPWNLNWLEFNELSGQ